MRSKTILFSIFLMLCFGIWSCSKDDSSDKNPIGSNGGCDTFVTEYEGVTDAAAIFSQNPTTENCEAYKAAYLNFFEAYSDCDYWVDGDYQSEIDAINDMDCSDL